MNESNQENQAEIKYSNVLLSDQTHFAKPEAKHKFCFLYFCGVFSLLILLSINFFLTSGNLEANEYVPLPIEVACNTALRKYEKCLEADTDKEKEQDNCIEESASVEQCYSSVFEINKMCFIYISEYHLCKSKNQSCSGITADFIECANKYKGIRANELLSLIN